MRKHEWRRISMLHSTSSGYQEVEEVKNDGKSREDDRRPGNLEIPAPMECYKKNKDPTKELDTILTPIQQKVPTLPWHPCQEILTPKTNVSKNVNHWTSKSLRGCTSWYQNSSYHNSINENQTVKDYGLSRLTSWKILKFITNKQTNKIYLTSR